MTWRPRWPFFWRPERLHVFAGLAALAVLASLLTLIAPWDSDSDTEPDAANANATRTVRPTRTNATAASPTPTAVPTPDPTPTLTVGPPAPTQPPTQPPAQDPTARLAQLIPWNGADSHTIELAMFPGGSDEALLATQREARVWKVSLSGAFAPVLLGDLSDRVGTAGGEEGLLSAAFSPQFSSDARVYVYYTRGAPEPTILSRFQLTNDVLDTANETVILQIPDFAPNHNGGRIAFGMDGYLYLSTGDGGGGGDPNENGQDINSMLGKVLRLDVNGQQTYGIPADNPFVGVNGADEVWAFGFRNPWRMSVDIVTGDIWLGDVGQGSWEEVNRVVRAGNHGWDCYEGFAVYEADGCPAGGFVPPRAVYSLAGDECAVSGGFVYRGGAIPSLYGWYVYGDFCSGKVWAVNPSDDSNPVLLADTPYNISSFAQLPGGELAVLTFNGTIYKLVP